MDERNIPYMQASEMMSSLIYLMERNLYFMEENKIKPDDSVRKALKPVMEKLDKWIKST